MIDSAQIILKAGNGGNGSASLHREKFIPKGGPDGGDGGKGGDIWIMASREENTLFEFNRLKLFSAQNGANGGKNKKFGKSGVDLILNVPLGTLIYEGKDKYSKIVADLTNHNEKILIAKGGKGGLGNIHFKSATNQTPLFSGTGQPGEEKKIDLELKILADVGIIGLPNVGKSTLLNMVSNANSKVGNYSFTTIEPVLGKVNYLQSSFIMADIPGLIEGAHTGKGLGIKFLKHIERTKILLHLVDGCSNDSLIDYNTIRKEIEKFNPILSCKPELIVITKSDLINELKRKEIIKLFRPKKIYFTSKNSFKSYQEILGQIASLLTKLN